MTQLSPGQLFGKRLRQLRREKAAAEERDVEQSEVAGAVGETQPNVARHEGGRMPKDDATVKRYATFYGVNWIWLRHGEGAKYPEPTPAVEVVAGAAPRRPRAAESPTKRQKGAR